MLEPQAKPTEAQARAHVTPVGRPHWRFFASSRAHWLIGAIALAASSVCLRLGKLADDYWLEAALAPRAGVSAAFSRAPWDAFAYVRSGDHLPLREVGVVPWWSDEHTAISLLRPLSSLSHALDFALFADSPRLMHAHSMLWLALLLFGAQRVYSALVPGRVLGGLCLLVFALDHGRAMTIGWLSNRNALVALAIAFHAIAEHHTARAQGDRGARLRGVGWLALGLCGAESAVQVLGYLVAYAVFLDRGSVRARLVSLAPYLTLVAVWRILYSALGYGAVGSSVYLDPGREPLRFAVALLGRVPRYLLASLAFPPSDAWSALELMPAPLAWLGYAALAGLAVALVLLLRPLAKRSPQVRFWLLGALLASLPVCANVPNDRMLTATSLGASAVLASLLETVVARSHRLTPHVRLQPAMRSFADALLAWHVALAPLLLSARVLALGHAERVMERAYASLPSTPRDATLVLVNPPSDVFAAYFPMIAASSGRTLPSRFRWLATGESELRLYRAGDASLRLTVARGLAANPDVALFTGPGHVRHVGDVVALDGTRFETRGLDEHGRVREVEVSFDLDLDDARLVLVEWRDGRFVRVHPPAPGQERTLPALNLAEVLLGEG